MPFMSETQVENLRNFVQRTRDAHKKFKEKLKIEEVVGTAEVVAGGALAGYLHTRFADEEGKLDIPGVKVDALMVGGAALIGLGYMELSGRYDRDLMRLGSGVLAGFAFKKMEQIGTNAKVKGNVFGQLSGTNAAVGYVGAMTDSELAQSLRRSRL